MSLEKKIRKFLQGPRKGEAFELKNGLVSQYKHERKDAIQRVIQAMTLGKDVSSLFPDVLKNIATYDLEQKKLVYLYLMNYATTHPELCILAVNTFVQDTEDPNPLIRALAIRTMGCIRVQKMIDYMEIPLSRTLQDENPYVRKTAAICVAKLFNLNPQMCIEFGFLDSLKKLISDPNPSVISNVLNALYEINDMYISSNLNKELKLDILVLDYTLIKNLLVCLNECTEWGRLTILKCLNDYDSENSEQANHIVERIIPQLQHINPAIVLSSIKTILKHLVYLQKASQTSILKKLSSPLVSLISNPIPEAQYVGLKNIRIILEKYPNILSKELRVFFVKYSDPLYLKLEKLDIMIRLCNENNFNLLLNELKEYSMEFEPTLISKSIKSIGSIAIKLPTSIIKCVNLIIELIDLKGDELIIDESVGVLTMILRKYPGKNDLITLILPIIANNFSHLSIANPSYSSVIWLLGEYPNYFTNISNLLNEIFEDFNDFGSQLKLNWLNTIVKVNLNSLVKQDFSKLLQETLTEITENEDDVDLRDRAYIYWRLLSSAEQELPKQILLAKLPPIDSSIETYNPVILNDLMSELSTLSSVYGKPSYTFISNQPSSFFKSMDIDELKAQAKQDIIENVKNENLLDFDDDFEENGNASEGASTNSNNLLDELNDLFSNSGSSPASNTSTMKSNTDDILSLFNTLNVTSAPMAQPSQQQSQSSSNNDNKVNNDLLDLF
ncbi:beta-adaptin [Yamadazyma tenuis]|uniref:AP complex subunit beta n=1 Tax=Candida tenuis (strain ATCC 10573 / BCRC 21748 / CBS 615 / JCM 9827 / NBRC 10315 / NRRL Y-1498 / VKM Y-70) TaxID=590646 RepID=G3B266_CANTC|nr:uncharacterized protein CANTEDRAFT_120327 [Yamadazyma tenuis ATCC 10573]EGV64606.1 hypothetical protein CANTEDRAFT_120327 [Yamadazyma tenuis ATCC 10573]WEJ97381.1 beta-adaptin [Yamadazyma tenuis]